MAITSTYMADASGSTIVDEALAIEKSLRVAANSASNSIVFCAANAAIHALWRTIARRVVMDLCQPGLETSPAFKEALTKVEESGEFAKRLVLSAILPD
jgi:hypothetical protein